MRLWYKAWRESRTRFLLSTLTIVGLCTFFVLFHNEVRSAVSDEPLLYIPYIWRIIYKGYLRELFVVLVLLLGMGGLLRERAYGTATFTLALPVSRRRLVAARAAVGLLEVAVLAGLPLLVIPTLSPLVQRAYPFSLAVQFSLLWTVCGAFLFAVGLLASVVFAGEYAAPLVSFAAVLMYSFVVDWPGMERYLMDIHDVMSGAGMPYFNSDTALLTGPLPWRALAAVLLAAFLLMTLAVRITQKQDF